MTMSTTMEMSIEPLLLTACVSLVQLRSGWLTFMISPISAMTTTMPTDSSSAGTATAAELPNTMTNAAIQNTTGGRKRIRLSLSLPSSTCAGSTGMDWMTHMLLPSSETEELVGTMIPAIIATATVPAHTARSVGIMIQFMKLRISLP